MVYESLIAIAEKYKTAMAEEWFKEIKDSTFLSTYNNLTDPQIFERGKVLFENFYLWLQKGADDNFIQTYFQNVGRERAGEGFPLSEINYALFLEKKVLWKFISQKEVDTLLTPADAVEFLAVISSYFDMGEFYILRGYMLHLIDNLNSSGKFTEDEMASLLNGALIKEENKEISSELHLDALDLNFLKK
ncbi:MAG: hypothetical protein D6830_05970 [Ignavibacteria bacterium]|nr:MAG: hypothetical protein D6830_05970 [Ignavibacteria bacterium]